MGRQWSAKPLFSGSNPDAASIANTGACKLNRQLAGPFDFIVIMDDETAKRELIGSHRVGLRFVRGLSIPSGSQDGIKQRFLDIGAVYLETFRRDDEACFKD